MHSALALTVERFHGFSGSHSFMARKNADLQLLGDTLTRQYRLSCELYNTFPIGRITHQLSQGNLFVDLSTVDHDHLEALCHLLQNKVTPQMLKFNIPSSVEVGARILQQAVRGISLCVSQSYTLTSLELSNIKLKGNNLELVCQGLSKSRNLKILSFVSCSLHDIGVERLCQSIKNVPSISELSLIDCCIPEKGATTIAGLLKHQRLNRDSAMWQDTLRLRHPHLDGMRGLRRVTVNYNPQLGDFGAKALAEVLLEDLWIKALDLQHCGIGEEGGLALKKILKTNHTIEVLDLRKNPFIPCQIVNEVISLLHERQEEYNTNQYTWLNSESDQNIANENVIKMKSPTRIHTAVRKNLKENVQKLDHKPQPSVKNVPALPKTTGIPWRVEHRLYERKEGLKPGSFIDSLVRSDITTPVAPQDSELSSEKTAIQFRKIKKLLRHYRHLYHKEKEARKRVEHKLSKLQVKINKCHMLDDQTVNHIETCFQRFQTFLSNLKSAGYHWQAEFLEDASRPKQVGDFMQDSISRHPSVSNPLDNFAGATPYADIDLLNFSTVNLPIFFRNREISEKDYLEENSSKPGSSPESHLKSAANVPERETSIENAAKRLYDENIDSLQRDFDRGKMLVSSGKSSENHVKSSANVPDKETSIEIATKQLYDENIDSLQRDFDTRKTLLSSGNHEEESSIHDITNASQNDNIEDKELSDQVQPEVDSGSSSAEDQETGANSPDMRETYDRINHKYEVLEPVKMSSEIENEDIYQANKRYYEIQMEQARVVTDQNLPEEVVTAAQAEKETLSNASEIYNDSSLKPMKGLKSFSPGKIDKNVHVLEKMSPNNKFSLQTHNIHSENLDASPKEMEFVKDFSTKEQEFGKNKEDSVTPTEISNSETLDGPLYSQRSETDDEKLQMKKTFRRAARSGSISSISITEHLSNSHSSWTKLGKPRVKKTVKYESPQSKTPMSRVVDSKEVETIMPKDIPMEYDSDFEVSDVEGLSISASSLTSTTIPDDLVTPGEEEF
ncbi:centrosomal protein of 78 kDa-like isoform X2 [Palaemon carinicauda]|uniref:centrosomal protein of 78 kDa-like isoform X2 n=1 Tax=Palaemon carinicauda TaxID=392227 RepID=UPI0035B63076